jgi:hypothetical protein
MRLSRTIFTAQIASKARVLFSILEKPNGELIIPFRAAERFGVDYTTGIPVLEQRYSIHPSLRSEEFTTVKHTTNLADGRQIVHVALTDAVKQKTGFSLMFVYRAPNMSPDKYLLSEKDKNRSLIVSLPEYDPKLFTLFCGVLLGSPEIEFKARHRHVLVRQHCFKRFRIVVLSGRLSLPSYHSSEIMQVLTLDPTLSGSVAEQAVRRQKMRGKSDGVCILQYLNGAYNLAKRFLEYALSTGQLTDPQMVSGIQQYIADLEKLIGTIPLAVDIGPQLIRKPTDEKPPNPQ